MTPIPSILPTDAIRAEFEKWCAYYGHPFQWDDDFEVYADKITQFMWQSWQARGQQFAEELVRRLSATYHEEGREWQNAITKAIAIVREMGRKV